jgi:hypothetical protein
MRTVILLRDPRGRRGRIAALAFLKLHGLCLLSLQWKKPPRAGACARPRAHRRGDAAMKKARGG